MPTTITAAVARMHKAPGTEAPFEIGAPLVRGRWQDINKAFAGSASGATVKPVIIF